MPLLGNVVISKNFLRTRKIMVMHSNEGESIVYVPTQTDCGSVSMNVDDGVVLAVIQITDDRVPNGRHLRVQHTYGAATSPP